jgi:hypothetical protein
MSVAPVPAVVPVSPVEPLPLVLPVVPVLPVPLVVPVLPVVVVEVSPMEPDVEPVLVASLPVPLPVVPPVVPVDCATAIDPSIVAPATIKIILFRFIITSPYRMRLGKIMQPKVRSRH